MSDLGFDGTLTLAFAAKDRKATAKWYTEHLGFEMLYDAADIGWLEMQTSVPGVTIGFSESMDVTPGNSVPVFGVSDIDKTRSKLEKAKIRFDGDTITHDGMVKLATFYDPDGNALMLAQNLATE